MSDRDDRIDKLYEAALKRPIGERAEFVATHSSGDADLQRRVAALLSRQQDTELPNYDGVNAGGASVIATGTLIGSYRIDGPLGAGGMGVVYKATDTKLNRPAAVKVLPESLADPDARRRFQREAKMVSSLNHPHIVTVYDAGEYQDRQYLITEYVDGGTLRQWAARPRAWLQIIELLAGVADGLSAAHDAGILHRDIKPENILLAKNGYAKLADFGLAKLLEIDPFADEPLSAVRAAGHSSLIGTAAYMSPEQAQGLPLDARSDVYSFGLVLYELLKGARPFADPEIGLRRGAESEPIPPLGEQVPAELRALVAKALEREPADRYQTMRDLVVDLRRLVRRSGVEAGGESPSLDSSARRTGPMAAAPQRVWPQRVAYLAVALAGLAFVGSLARDYFRGPQEAIAVLPFVNETGDPADAYISESLGDELRGRLMGLGDVRVVSRPSSISFRDQSVDPRTIANRLGAKFLVNGTLQRRGRTLTVLVEIVDAQGLGLNSERYETEEQGLLAMQQQIATQVARFLAPDASGTVAAAAPTSEREAANTLVTLGRYYDNEVRDTLSLDAPKLTKAIDFYLKATMVDPSWVRAHSWLASAYLYLGDIDSAREPLEKALALAQSPEVPAAEASDTYYSLALYLLRTRATEGIDEAYEKSIYLNPNNADALRSYAQWLMTHLRPKDGEELFRRAISLDPQNLLAYSDYAEYLGIFGPLERLSDLADTIESRFPNARGYVALARLNELRGDLDVGIAWGLKALELQPGYVDAQWQVAELYSRIGDFAKAAEHEPEPDVSRLLLQRRYDELIELTEELMFKTPDEVRVPYLLAFAYNATGRFEQAESLLRRRGLPEISGNASSTAWDDEAFVSYVDALMELGEEARARQLNWEQLKRPDGGATEAWFQRSWWGNSYAACRWIIAGDVPAALDALDLLRGSYGLPWSYVLLDSPCFKRISKEPRYLAVIAYLGERQRELRERLPATLAKYGVADLNARPL